MRVIVESNNNHERLVRRTSFRHGNSTTARVIIDVPAEQLLRIEEAIRTNTNHSSEYRLSRQDLYLAVGNIVQDALLLIDQDAPQQPLDVEPPNRLSPRDHTQAVPTTAWTPFDQFEVRPDGFLQARN